MSTASAETFGVLNDDAIARSRGRNGVPQRIPTPPHNFEVTVDGVRHFAYGYGDDNPLYCDPDYAAGTRWGGLIGPPTFLYTMGEDAAPNPTPETKALLKGDPFAGLGLVPGGDGVRVVAPVARSATGCAACVPRSGWQTSRARSAVARRTSPATSSTPTAQASCTRIRRGTWINAERHSSRKRKKERRCARALHAPSSSPRSTPPTRPRQRRGSEPRYFEDVAVGEELPAKVKGPLTTTDVIVWHLGWGMQLTPPGAFQLAYQVRSKVARVCSRRINSTCPTPCSASTGNPNVPTSWGSRRPTTTAGCARPG